MAPGRIAALLAPTPSRERYTPSRVDVEVGLDGATACSGARSGTIVGQRRRLAVPALAARSRQDCFGGWLDGFDGDGGAVGGDLGHDVADLVAVDPHRDDGVGAPGAGFTLHPLPGQVAAARIEADPAKTRRQRPDQRVHARRLTHGRPAGHRPNPIFERDRINCVRGYPSSAASSIIARIFVRWPSQPPCEVTAAVTSPGISRIQQISRSALGKIKM
jgi:hypothetical protein